MKKFLLVLFAVLTIMFFSACDNVPVVEKYYLGTNGNLIAEFEDGTTEDLGKFGNDSINTIDTIAISDDGFYVLNGIKTDIVAVEMYDVTFNTGFSTNVAKQTIKDGYKVERPNLERTGYTLNGWYCNGEEWCFNSDVVKNDMILTADWIPNEYLVSFDTDGADSIASITIKTDETLTLPVPEKELYTFDSWFYKGRKINSGSFTYAENLDLVAQWHRTQYDVSFSTNGGNTISTIKVNSFSEITELPTPTRNEYEFMGWYLNDEKIELPYNFTEGNITLLAQWRGISEDFDFVEEENGTDIKILKYKGNKSEVIIPETLGGKTVTTIASDCFKDNATITSITFHSKVINFGYKSIYNCTNLEEITISGDINATLIYIFGSEDNIPTKLSIVNFAKNSSTYNGGVFKDIIYRTFIVNVYAELTTTPADAFCECSAIKKIYFHGDIKTFSSRTICANSNLEYVNIPETVTFIGMNNFINCPKLEYLIVPISVKSVGYAGLAIDGVLLVEATERPWGSNAYSIYENKMDIFYGFEKLVETEDFLYALCKVGSVTRCIIIQRYNSNVEYPEYIEEYPVVFTNDNYTKEK